MPSNSGKSSSGGAKRYAGKEKRGASEYKKEWSRFMTQVGRKRTSTGLNPNNTLLPANQGNQQKSSSAGGELEKTTLKPALDLQETLQSSTFSYLFHSKTAALKQKQEELKRKQELNNNLRAKRRQRNEYEDDEEEDNNNEEAAAARAERERKSKMEKAIQVAEEKGVNLEGLNRKQRRAALQLTRTEAVEQVEEQRKKITPKDLMDPKLQWYQQGPYPLDEITEKLVNKKAQKHIKTMPELKLDKYNWQMIHPSWLAARQRKRFENILHPLHEGKRTVFANDDDQEDEN
jgi:flagellar biosynthesis GTPase FlhF